jgi:5-formyltetrahydrofolate cyclo-ligase
MNKDELRKIYLAKRLALTENEYTTLSHKIADLFFRSVDLSQIKIIHIYLPIESKHEPDTRLIIDRLQSQFPHIRLVVPRVKGDEMENIFFEGSHQLEKTKWGMVEPKQGALAHPKEIDAVIVPLLIFDDSGHRLGYGKGFYDRFLKTCSTGCKKIGLSFFDSEVQIENISPFDVKLTYCITPSRVLEFES